MSGGSYDYAYRRIDDLADQIREDTAQRKAFVALLRQVANAAHDIEWVDSADYGDGDENDAIQSCFALSFPQALIRASVAQLRKASEAALSVCDQLEKESNG